MFDEVVSEEDGEKLQPLYSLRCSQGSVLKDPCNIPSFTII